MEKVGLRLKGLASEWVFSSESLVGFVDGAEKKIVGVCRGSLVVKMIDKGVCNKMIVDNHYSHKTATDSHTLLHLGIFFDDVLVGAMQYGYAMNPASCDKIVKGTKLDEYYELNRLWLSDVMPKNSETAVISMSIKLIKKINPKIKWIQSFADGRVGVGTIYKASSFVYCGSHKEQFIELGGILHHGGKFRNKTKTFGRMYGYLWKVSQRLEFLQYRYIFFIDKGCRKDLLLEELNYPVLTK